MNINKKNRSNVQDLIAMGFALVIALIFAYAENYTTAETKDMLLGLVVSSIIGALALIISLISLNYHLENISDKNIFLKVLGIVLFSYHTLAMLTSVAFLSFMIFGSGFVGLIILTLILVCMYLGIVSFIELLCKQLHKS